MALLKERVEQLVALGRLDDAQEFTAYLIDFCQNHPWAEWAEMVINRLRDQTKRLPMVG